MDMLAFKEGNNRSVSCGNCDKTSSESCYCFQCSVFWCADCINVHNALRSNKGHRVLALKDIQDKDFEDLLKQPVFCSTQRHETNELKFFCQECNNAVCQTCVFIEHSGHSLQYIEEQAEEQKLEIKSLIERQIQKLEKKMVALDGVKDDSIRVKQYAAKVKEDMQDFVDNTISIIESKKQDLLKAVDEETTKTLESLDRKRNKIQEQIVTTKSVVEKTETLLKLNTSAGIIQLKNTVEDMFEDVDKDYESESNYEGYFYFRFVKNKTIVESLNAEEIGSVIMSYTKAIRSSAVGKGLTEAKTGLAAEFVVSTRNAQGRQCYCKSDILEVEIRDQKGRDCATNVQISDHKDGTYTIRYFVGEPGYCRVVVKVNAEHVHGSPFTTEVKHREFKPVLSFGGEGSSPGQFKQPWGVAVNNADEIAVTDYENKRVQIFISNGSFLSSFGSGGKTPGKFKCPSGIVFDESGNILVADSANQRIQTFSRRGSCIREFRGGPIGTLTDTISRPRCLSFDSDGNLVVADPVTRLIKIFSPSGIHLGNIGQEITSKMPLCCIAHGGHLIVSDGHEHCIKVFDKERKFLYQFGRHGKEHGCFNVPHGLAIDKSGNLLVCDIFNHRIQVFKLNGEFLGSFGTRGNAPGSFNAPETVAVLSDGRIVVCDSKNHRIQIFE